MKLTSPRIIRLLLVLLCLVAVIPAFTACAGDVDMGNNVELSRRFMDHVLADDYDAAYAMVRDTVQDADFRPYWQDIRAAMEGASSYEMEMTAQSVKTRRKLSTRTTEFCVTTDTDRTIYLKTVTRDDYTGIAGIQFTDVTELLESSDGYLPTARIVLYILSGLFILLVIWAFIDCLRRKMKYKLVWALVILFSIGLAVSLGNTPNLSFDMGLFFELSTINAVLSRNAVVAVLNIPLGAILYLCLRKRFTAEASEPDGGSAKTV